MSAIFATFILSFKTLFRNLKSTAIIFVLPIVFMAIFGLAFGGENKVKFNLGIYQEEISFSLSEIFKEIDNKNENIQINIQNYNNLSDLKKDLNENKIDLGLYLDKKLENGGQFEIFLAKNNPSTQINSSIVIDILNQVFFEQSSIKKTIINNNDNNFNSFNFLAPGLIVYGLIILIPSIIAQSFSQIGEKKYIFRYSFAKISAIEIILGNILFYFLLGIIQTIILYYTATLFGYQATGNVFIALVPIFLTLFFVISIGLIIGSLFSKSESATNIGTIVNIILGFFSGSFIANVGSLLEFKFLSLNLQFNDILPTKWGTVVVDKILTNNLNLVDIQDELLILAISGIISLFLSITIYSKKQLKFIE